MRELSLNVLDIAQNSVAAGASLIEIALTEEPEKHSLAISIRDNGKGMTPQQVAAVEDPFFTTRTTRKVGMGVPLFKLAAEQTGGSLTIQSEVGAGTDITAYFRTDHLDFTPVGDMASTMTALITMNLHIDFVYRRTYGEKSFTVDTRELKKILGEVPLNEPSIAQWITQFINENTQEIFTEV